jgi:hypothetical protein
VVGLVNGDTVLLGNDTDGSPFGTVTTGDVTGSGAAGATVNPGDVVQNGSNIYRYVGSAATTIDFSGTSSFTTSLAQDPSEWAQLGGTAGAVYRYIGTTQHEFMVAGPDGHDQGVAVGGLRRHHGFRQ